MGNYFKKHFFTKYRHLIMLGIIYMVLNYILYINNNFFILYLCPISR